MNGLNRITGGYVQGMHEALGLSNAPSDTLSMKVTKVALSIFVGMYQGAKAAVVQPFHLLPTPIKFVALLAAPLTVPLGFIGGAIAGVVTTISAIRPARTDKNSGEILRAVLNVLDAEQLKRARVNQKVELSNFRPSESEMKDLEAKVSTGELRHPNRRLTDQEFNTGFCLAIHICRESKIFDPTFQKLVDLARDHDSIPAESLREIAFELEGDDRERLRLLMQVSSDLAGNDDEKINQLANRLLEAGSGVSPTDVNYLLTSLKSLIQNQEAVFRETEA